MNKAGGSGSGDPDRYSRRIQMDTSELVLCLISEMKDALKEALPIMREAGESCGWKDLIEQAEWVLSEADDPE